ncbi:MAG: GNAT family N-acetyltransferase [Ktedonobacteraceae bacterium]
MPGSTETIRVLKGDDLAQILRLLRTSEYGYQRFTLDELPNLLAHYPALGVFSGPSLHSFLLSQTVYPPSAWIAGFCVSWTESNSYQRFMTALLERMTPLLIARKVRYLHYSGNDIDQDWLRTVLLGLGFLPYRLLYAYDKYDFAMPTRGNQQVIVRPFELRDVPALLAIEDACFEDLWRYDALAFRNIAATHPYFVVAELNGSVVGYQFNTIDYGSGYLVRIAVHPSVNSRGIGARLMAEAITFFQKAAVGRIMLNTQDDNVHAHRLYEWFGFVRLRQRGFVLRKTL